MSSLDVEHAETILESILSEHEDLVEQAQGFGMGRFGSYEPLPQGIPTYSDGWGDQSLLDVIKVHIHDLIAEGLRRWGHFSFSFEDKNVTFEPPGKLKSQLNMGNGKAVLLNELSRDIVVGMIRDIRAVLSKTAQPSKLKIGGMTWRVDLTQDKDHIFRLHSTSIYDDPVFVSDEHELEKLAPPQMKFRTLLPQFQYKLEATLIEDERPSKKRYGGSDLRQIISDMVDVRVANRLQKRIANEPK